MHARARRVCPCTVINIYRLYLGIADIMSIARYGRTPILRNGHAVGDAEIEPMYSYVSAYRMREGRPIPDRAASLHE